MVNKKIRKDKTFPQYQLIINDKKITIYVKRITDFKNKFNNLIRRKLFLSNQGYFQYKTKGFQSFFLNFDIDLIFVNWDHVVIAKEEKFTSNKVSPYHEDTKFLYILPEGTILKQNIKLGDSLKHQKVKSTKKNKQINF